MTTASNMQTPPHTWSLAGAAYHEGPQGCAGCRHNPACGTRYIIVAAAGYFFAATYWTCTCSMVPLNLNGTLS